jgi:hypothetical protein
MTVERIRSEIRNMDPNVEEDSDNFRAALILLSALEVGTTIHALVRFTGLPRVSVTWIVNNIRRNGIFTRKGQIGGAAWFEKDGGISFWLDVCSALGLMEKTRRKKAA